MLSNHPDFLFYIDPPYFKRGEQLYAYSFTNEDHTNLAYQLKKGKKNNWVLSYDNCSQTKALYKWASIKEHQMTYSITTGSRNGANTKGKELIITKTEASND